jgi:hypothetical protein
MVRNTDEIAVVPLRLFVTLSLVFWHAARTGILVVTTYSAREITIVKQLEATFRLKEQASAL